MLTHHRRPICLSLFSTDLPICSTIEAAATLYQKDRQRFHLLFYQLDLPQPVDRSLENGRLLWLEISPYRAIMTMQGKDRLAYRHYWEQGIYGISRYWFNGSGDRDGQSFRLRNYTRSLQLEGSPLPTHLRVEYELWSQNVRLGHYVLHLEIYH
ncbi:hypothetical protein Ple7327_1262 [Pleurocapsa sp. PCC 7327]|uniref:hypothetical protein n=1 Tax=Pleurocapsa sp. PCC 7327 TaxID=118163 RepID=UPI00029F8399|nr:hypothetical protein [Pleurocapsa sp. PCC 7327]AFY76656.1 hypothetical protein Ple7327_1262 [Pleurocapsa sp. PCC 7327]